MSDHVTITRQPGAPLASFSTISRQQADMAFWQNQDSEPHFPTFPAGAPVLSNQVGAHATSGSVQPALALTSFYPSTGPIALPQGQVFPVDYICSLHPGESGIINVYADFYSVPSQLSPLTRGTKATVNLTIGGMPPYTMNPVSNSNLPASLKVKILVDTQGPALTGTPGPNDAGNFAFDLVCEDSDGNNVTQTYLVTVT